MYNTYVQVYTYTVRSEDILQYLYTNPPSQAISISQTTMYLQGNVHCPERSRFKLCRVGDVERASIPSICHKIRHLPAFSLSAQWLNLIRLTTPHYQIFNARAFYQVSINHPLITEVRAELERPNAPEVIGQVNLFLSLFFPASPRLTSPQQASKHHVSEPMFRRSSMYGYTSTVLPAHHELRIPA